MSLGLLAWKAVLPHWPRKDTDNAPRVADYFRVIPSYLPPTLKHVIVFEDFNEDIDQIFRYNSEPPFRPELVRTPSPSVARAAALASMSLTTLSASYIVEAGDFFLPIACGTMTGTWDRLETLVLTSLVLRGESPLQEVASLVTLAGRTVP